MFEDSDRWLEILILIGFYLVGIVVGFNFTKPTELPNGCLLYDDVIYCEEVNK